MRLYVGFKVFDTLIDPTDINRARATFGEKMQVIGPKLESSGVFAGRRQGFMVMDVASEDEAFFLLAELADFCDMDVHPLASFETLGKYLAENPL
jgi:hypothetical protein